MSTKEKYSNLLVMALIGINLLFHLARRIIGDICFVLGQSGNAPGVLIALLKRIEPIPVFYAWFFAIVAGLLLLCGGLNFSRYCQSLAACLLLPFPVLAIEQLLCFPLKRAGLYSYACVALDSDVLWYLCLAFCAIYAAKRLFSRHKKQ